MDEVRELIKLLESKAKLVAMLAPSFPINYQYPQIITRLKNLGFSYVVEVAAGAKKTNEEVLTLLKNNPSLRFITSPCPCFVSLVKVKYPHLLKYLALSADSPMIETTKIVKEKYPDFLPVFIGPCIAKKKEASEDHPDLNLLVITYKELEEVFAKFNVPNVTDSHDSFDISEKDTRIYPFDGGLTISSGLDKILKPEEIKIVSGWKNCETTLLEFENNPKLRLIDVLFCEGGCINGPAINKELSVEQRKQKIQEFANSKL
ncbi:MAG: hypothetical protein A2152_02520 [Candidatus Levybacteria bacterium RBG_16_35_6]|nr:MAG: hypothetical protein A2152_02520 [Candidatus Levybacteria bacterium RBG_16_35_6]